MKTTHERGSIEAFLARRHVNLGTWMALVRKMRDQVVEDIDAGIVPKKVRGFSELHDYTDANFYGHVEKVVRGEKRWIPAIPALRRRSWDSWVEIASRAQSVIGLWLAKGRTNVALKAAALASDQELDAANKAEDKRLGFK